MINISHQMQTNRKKWLMDWMTWEHQTPKSNIQKILQMTTSRHASMYVYINKFVLKAPKNIYFFMLQYQFQFN